MDETLKKRIIADIQKTGFPSELKVAAILKKDNWTIEQNGTYLDYETNQSREIDIKAYKLFSEEKSKFYFFVHLIIEVKKIDTRPWIFFVRENISKPVLNFIGPGYSQIITDENFRNRFLPARQLMELFPRNEEDAIGTAYYDAFKAVDEPSKIYGALLSAIKGAFHEAKISEGESKKEEKFNPEEIIYLNIFMPIVILDGLMFKASLNDDETVNLEETNYVPIEISHTTKPYDYHFNYYPEVMVLKYFEQFLSRVNKWGTKIAATASKNVRVNTK